MKKVITIVLRSCDETSEPGFHTWIISLFGSSAGQEQTGCDFLAMISCLNRLQEKELPYALCGQMPN